jgi:hypothetical protein
MREMCMGQEWKTQSHSPTPLLRRLRNTILLCVQGENKMDFNENIVISSTVLLIYSIHLFSP